MQCCSVATSPIRWLLRSTAGECLHVCILQGVKENIYLPEAHPCPCPWHWLWHSWEHYHFHRLWQHLLPFAFLLRCNTMCCSTTPSSCWKDSTLALYREQQAEPEKPRMEWDTLAAWGLSLFPMPLKEQWSLLPTSTHSERLLTSPYLKVNVEQETIPGSIPKFPSSEHCSGNHPLAGTWCWAQMLIRDTDTFLCGGIVKVYCRVTNTHQQSCHKQKLAGRVNLGTKIPKIPLSKSEDKRLSKGSNLLLTSPQHKRAFLPTTETIDKSNGFTGSPWRIGLFKDFF